MGGGSGKEKLRKYWQANDLKGQQAREQKAQGAPTVLEKRAAPSCTKGNDPDQHCFEIGLA